MSTLSPLRDVVETLALMGTASKVGALDVTASICLVQYDNRVALKPCFAAKATAFLPEARHGSMTWCACPRVQRFPRRFRSRSTLLIGPPTLS